MDAGPAGGRVMVPLVGGNFTGENFVWVGSVAAFDFGVCRIRSGLSILPTLESG